MPNATSAIWLELQNCLWRGPENLLDKVPLATLCASYRNSQKIRILFIEKLGIRNANWTDYLDALLQFKMSQNFPPDLQGKVLQLYELLRDSILSEEDFLSLM